ncbi:hypothetical protein BJ165DRAFT_666954 [Panaeolus papilionaceus]|nr:hypothetical protein BJ165DRAFT_666954 [Panaeolus papilionaceus]
MRFWEGDVAVRGRFLVSCLSLFPLAAFWLSLLVSIQFYHLSLRRPFLVDTFLFPLFLFFLSCTLFSSLRPSFPSILLASFLSPPFLLFFTLYNLKEV